MICSNKIVSRKKFNVFEAVTMFLLVIYGLAVLTLILWGFSASFRTYASIMQKPWGIFSDLGFENYVGVFNDFKTLKEYDGGFKTVFFEEMFFNSLLCDNCAFFKFNPISIEFFRHIFHHKVDSIQNGLWH